MWMVGPSWSAMIRTAYPCYIKKEYDMWMVGPSWSAMIRSTYPGKVGKGLWVLGLVWVWAWISSFLLSILVWGILNGLNGFNMEDILAVKLRNNIVGNTEWRINCDFYFWEEEEEGSSWLRQDGEAGEGWWGLRWTMTVTRGGGWATSGGWSKKAAKSVVLKEKRLLFKDILYFYFHRCRRRWHLQFYSSIWTVSAMYDSCLGGEG